MTLLAMNSSNNSLVRRYLKQFFTTQLNNRIQWPHRPEFPADCNQPAVALSQFDSPAVRHPAARIAKFKIHQNPTVYEKQGRLEVPKSAALKRNIRTAENAGQEYSEKPTSHDGACCQSGSKSNDRTYVQTLFHCRRRELAKTCRVF